MCSNQLRKLYAKNCKQICSAFSLNRLELDVLIFLANNAPYDTARDIAQLRGIAKSNVSAAVEKLVRKKLLITREDTDDRRCVHLLPTELAMPAIRQGQAMQRQLLKILTVGISAEDWQTVERINSIIQENVRKAMENDL